MAISSLLHPKMISIRQSMPLTVPYSKCFCGSQLSRPTGSMKRVLDRHSTTPSTSLWHHQRRPQRWTSWPSWHRSSVHRSSGLCDPILRPHRVRFRRFLHPSGPSPRPRLCQRLLKCWLLRWHRLTAPRLSKWLDVDSSHRRRQTRHGRHSFRPFEAWAELWPRPLHRLLHHPCSSLTSCLRCSSSMQNSAGSIVTNCGQHPLFDFLSSLPSKAATEDDIADFGDELCFCMVDYELDDLVVTTTCNHRYHEGCLKRWLEGSIKCPVCNKEFPAEMHKSVLRPSEASEEQVVEASVSPFDVVLQEGDAWTCPECIPLTGVPVDEPYQDEGGCSRCGVSRNPWDLICAHQASFHTIAQCIVDNYGISQLNSTLPPAQAPQASVGDSVGVRRTVSNAVDLQRVEVPLALRRDRVMQSVVAKLQEGGWSIREAIQRMLEGERREWELVTCTPDPRSAVLTRHLLRLVSDPRRLDRARQTAEPSPMDEIRAKHYYERYAPVFKGIVSRLKYGVGPASDDTAGSQQGLLCLFESMGWEIGLGVHRMVRGRFDMKEHWRAVDTSSKVLLEHISDLIRKDAESARVDEVEFVTLTMQLLLDTVCSETGQLNDTELVLFLSTLKDLATNLAKDGTNPKHRAINLSPGSLMSQRLGRFHCGRLAIYLLGYESGPAPLYLAVAPRRAPSGSGTVRRIASGAKRSLLSGLRKLRSSGSLSPTSSPVASAPDFEVEEVPDDAAVLWLSSHVSRKAHQAILEAVKQADAMVMGKDGGGGRSPAAEIRGLLRQLAAALE
eukprot:m.253312 g.253312  ORF g.253312 m.253312 type:complete len:784 (+) comp26516_c0_seq15:428-2779(+)